VTSGLFLKILEGKKKEKYPKSLASLVAKVRESEERLKAAVSFVKEQNDHFCTDYHARGLVDMAVETLMGILLIENAANSEQKMHVTRRFVEDSHLKVKMLAEKVLSQDAKAIDGSRGMLDQA
jgi:hypothetical protein